MSNNEKRGLFDWLHSLNFSKTDFMLDDEEAVKQYDPFMVGRGVAMSIDTLEVADKVQHLKIPKDVHYRYLLAAIPKSRRFGEWPKKNKCDEGGVETIMKYYQVNRDRAHEYARLLTPEQIKELEHRMDAGGRTK